LQCPHGHVVDRDAVAVLNMLWKTTPTGWVKTVWWGVKEARNRLEKGIVPREAVRKANLIIPRPAVHAVLVSLMALKAGGKWPAVLARAAPMTPARGAYEDGGEGASEPPFRAGGQCTNARLRARSARRAVSGMARAAGSIRPAARDVE
jgi:putative transposase